MKPESPSTPPAAPRDERPPSLAASRPSLLPGWQCVPLGEVIAGARPGFACGERDATGVIQLRMNNVDTRGQMLWGEVIRVPCDNETVEKHRLAPGDVLFNNTNSVELVGKTALFTGHAEPVVYSNHFTRLRVKSQICDSEFLAAWLLHQWHAKVFENLCNRWIGQSAVRYDRLSALGFPLPPLPEQRRIAAKLREQMSAVERVRIDTERNLLDVLDKVHDIKDESIDPTHVFPLSQIYEGLLLKMGEPCVTA